MKVLVTGGSGLVGKHLRDILSNGNYIASKPWDLLNPDRVNDLLYIFQPDVVVHLAARVGGIMDNITYPVEYLEENTLMNTNLLRACHEHDVDKVIAMGSTCMYPDVLDEYPMKEEELFNGAPPPDIFAYAMSKRVMAAQIDSYVKEYKRDWSYLIPCNLYGEYHHFDNPNQCHFKTALIRKIIDSENEGRGEITLFGTGKPLRQFMYAGDLARTIKLMIENDVTDSFNVATPEENNIKDMAEITLKALNKDMKVVFDTDKPDGQYRKTVSCEKMLESVGDFEFTKLKDGVKKVYNEVIKKYGK